MRTGSSGTRLVVLRGNSGSGKSSIAARIRDRCGRGIALVAQDNIRRIILREHDRPGGANIGLIDTTVRYALDHGYHVVLEGILAAERYGPMLTTLRRDHAGLTACYYLDVPFDETVRRHATRPQASHFTPEDMAAWYLPCDLLPGAVEQVISAESTLDDSTARIIHDTRLDAART